MQKMRTKEELLHDFQTPKAEHRLIPFVRIDGDFSDAATRNAVLDAVKDAGYGGLSPIPVADMRRTKAATTPEAGTAAFDDAYEKLLCGAKERGLSVVYYDDIDFPSGYYMGKVVEEHPEARANYLVMREYECSADEMIHRKLDTNGVTMSIVAYEVDTGEITDIRDELVGDTLVWDPPRGNWNILQFICRPYEECPYVDALDYEASLRFVECSYGHFAARFAAYLGDVVRMTYYDDLQYMAPNRRMWSPKFNEVFKAQYGFDPAPYYPALFYDVGEKTEYYTACLMQCRAKMFADGFFRAVSDFTRAHGLLSTGHVSESKTAAVSNLFGDAMQFQAYAGAAGLDMIHAYMYGFNGLKLASSAAYNYGKELVTCEMYKNYTRLDRTILYKEAMNAYARGINCIMPNVMQWSGDTTYNHDVSMRNPEWRDSLPQFCAFAARCQALLQGGNHVCDVAMLYPIESLHSKVWLYDQKETAFQFPPVLAFADYLSNINALMNYCGRDLTVLHPDVFVKNGRAENGVFYLDNEQNPEQYHVLILPAMTMTSIHVLRLIRKFFESGGKIIATSVLPFKIMEDDAALRKEAADIIGELFGVSENVVNYVSDYEVKRSECGGMAVYLRSSMTDLDGTEYVEPNRLNEALWQFAVPVDIIFEHLPRIAQSGILSLNLPAFKHSGAAVEGIRSGGVFNYIHKRYADCDIYFISNTTVKDYEGRIILRGSLDVEAWNPMDGSVGTMDARYGYVGGTAYTVVIGQIPRDTALFLVCQATEETEPTEQNTFSDFGALRRHYERLSGKKTHGNKPHLFHW